MLLRVKQNQSLTLSVEAVEQVREGVFRIRCPGLAPFHRPRVRAFGCLWPFLRVDCQSASVRARALVQCERKVKATRPFPLQAQIYFHVNRVLHKAHTTCMSTQNGHKAHT